jgi:hypothetical protein
VVAGEIPLSYSVELLLGALENYPHQSTVYLKVTLISVQAVTAVLLKMSQESAGMVASANVVRFCPVVVLVMAVATLRTSPPAPAPPRWAL